MSGAAAPVDLHGADGGGSAVAPSGGVPGRPVPAPRRGPPPTVWWATALVGLLGALWSVVVPQMRAPDEAAHVDLVMHLAEGSGYPSYDGRYIGAEVGLASKRYLADSRHRWPRFDAADAPARGRRPGVDDLGGTAPDPRARPPDARRPDHPYVYNQMPQHPPLYYLAMAGVVRLERALLPGDRPPLDREVGLLRLVDVALVLPLPILAWATVVRLGGSESAAAAASLLPLGLPQLLHVAGSVNNDNLLVLLGASLAPLVVAVGRGARTRRTDLAVGLLLALALLTKAFAVMYLPWVAAAYLVGAWTTRRLRDAAAGLGVATALAGVGGAWWVANLVREGQVAPTTETLTRTVDDRPAGFTADAVAFAWTFAGRLASRTWAWVGYRTPKFELPPLVVGVLGVAVVVATVAAVRSAAPGRDPAGGPRRADAALAWAPLGLVVAFVAKRAWGLYETTGMFAFIQGRYLFSVLVPPLATVALGLHRLLGRRCPAAVLAVAVTLQAWMLVDVLRGAWQGPGRWGAVRGMLAWSPWPTGGVLVVAAATGLAVLLAARSTVGGRLRRRAA